MTLSANISGTKHARDMRFEALEAQRKSNTEKFSFSEALIKYTMRYLHLKIAGRIGKSREIKVSKFILTCASTKIAIV